MPTTKQMKKIKLNIIMIMMVLVSAPAFLTSCSDEPDVENYYITTKQYASDYIKDQSKFSSFVEILERYKKNSGEDLMGLLGSYGYMTLFAPTNDAINQFLKEQGVSSIDQLPDSVIREVALTHIIEQDFYTSDINNGTFSTANMNDRYLSITSVGDSSALEHGKSSLRMYINKTALIIHADDSVKNGVVHTMGGVITSKNNMLPQLISEDSNVSLFSYALTKTHMCDSMQRYVDKTYSVGSDSTDWTNNKLCIHTAVEYDNVAYPKKRFFKYTAFIEPDTVYRSYFSGKNDFGKVYMSSEDFDKAKADNDMDKLLDVLKVVAADIYDEVYPEDKENKDITSRSNSLNRFVSYHLLDRFGSYTNLTIYDGGNAKMLNQNFDYRKWDAAEWYETMMPYSIMKVSYPNTATTYGLFINRRGVGGRKDERGVFIPGSKIYSPSEIKFDQEALNGIYHYIKDVIHYGEKTQKEVLNERIRLDATSLSPDFMTSGARGHRTRSQNKDNENGKYGDGGQGANALSNTSTCIGFKPGTAKNFTFTDATHVHVRNRFLTFWSYQGDEVTVKGRFDLKVQLPPVPEGTYEIRFMTCVDFASRGIIQAYIDGNAAGIPFDMRPNGTVLFGNQTDDQLGDEEAQASFDKSIHNRGWMRGPGCYKPGGGTTSMRNLNTTIRKVIGTFVSHGKEYHELRFQQKMESTENEMNFDFIELCPSSVYNNNDIPEDKW